MATIAGVEVGAFAFPEEPIPSLNRTIGISKAGVVKIYKFRDHDNFFTISLKAKSTSVRDSLLAALVAAQDTTVSVDPDSHINLGNGAGTAVNAHWVDQTFNQRKFNNDVWDIVLRFRYSS